MSIFSAVLIFSLTAIAATKSANGIQCWVSNEGTVSPRVVSNQLGCLSLFQTEDRVASFGGVPSTPRTAHRQAELAMADGSCKKIEKLVYQADKTNDYASVYLCYCNTHLCNTPMKFKEFEDNGFETSKH
ncbi:Activin_recp domain-containing protein [Caenorhabditis elegans]|uniref:Activin_recp domain-containing protein n=1 Tax=Caenorhabditis elegans TaxID=6239 RepID=Q17925_CAEEL|nr:Activin_recp domain-containing protein [Caenorhabditis elegans]CCD64272.2 Activin_recp domain-containing protein [Caenorhabditis elegans]|eukprot:NP_504985.2 Uncharacterized protein CELE_C12D5.4 [Caenorhabditis elegans]